MDIHFDEVIPNGALGRNGTADVGGISVGSLGQNVRLVPLRTNGEALRAEIRVAPESAGGVARAIAEIAAAANPDLRQAIAEELRAAVLSIEEGLGMGIEDSVTSYLPPLPR